MSSSFDEFYFNRRKIPNLVNHRISCLQIAHARDPPFQGTAGAGGSFLEERSAVVSVQCALSVSHVVAP